MVCSADMTTPLSDEKTETRNTNDYAERVLRFKARGILTARLPAIASPLLPLSCTLFGLGFISKEKLTTKPCATCLRSKCYIFENSKMNQ